MAQNPLSVQMYTLRDAVAADYVGTLRAVAELGYRAVELVTLGDMTAQELRKQLDDLGLVASGIHTPLERLEKDADAALDDVVTLGAPYVIVPWVAPDRRQTAEDYRKLGGILSEIGRKAESHGLKLCYHNHDFEFQRFDEGTGLAILLEEADAKLVKSELDVYWVAKAGYDPVEVIRGMAGSVPILHLKDMADTAEREFAEVGNGTLDFPAILAAAEETGVEWFVVEQDVCKNPPLESVGTSLTYLRGLGLS